jgi:hypothetical protein
MNPEEEGMSAEELAEWCLSQPRRRTRVDMEIDDAWRQIDAEEAQARSIAESPVWKDPQFLNYLQRALLEKSRETTKHYIDGQSTRPRNISRMGNPKRGGDGRVLRDARGLVIWDTSAEQQSNSADANLRRAEENRGRDCDH